MTFPERVETARLSLRRWEDGDREAYARIWADADVWRALRGGAPFEAEFAEQRFEHHLRHWREYGFGLWALRERASEDVAGWVGAAHPKWVAAVSSAVEIGWTLRRPFWRRGLAGEGAAAAVEAAFTHLRLDELISLIDPDNARSIAVAEGLGMRPTGAVHPTLTGDLVAVHALSRAAWNGTRAPQ